MQHTRAEALQAALVEQVECSVPPPSLPTSHCPSTPQVVASLDLTQPTPSAAAPPPAAPPPTAATVGCAAVIAEGLAGLRASSAKCTLM